MADLARHKAATGGADLLFVGKVSPHKAPHDLVKMLAVLRRLYDPAARLHLVGSPLGETYEPALRSFIDELGLTEAVNFAGSVSGAELEAYLQSADVFVCASDHEGFCVPLAEAMGHGVPIVAYGVTAVPETVADAGLVLPDKSPVPLRLGGGPGPLRSDVASLSLHGGHGPAPPGSVCPTRSDALCRWCRRRSARPEPVATRQRNATPDRSNDRRPCQGRGPGVAFDHLRPGRRTASDRPTVLRWCRRAPTDPPCRSRRQHVRRSRAARRRRNTRWATRPTSLRPTARRILHVPRPRRARRPGHRPPPDQRRWRDPGKVITSCRPASSTNRYRALA